MPVLPQIAAHIDELTEIRRDFHAHPELGFQEHRTSARVAQYLQQYGVDEIHSGIGKTGVVGIIHGSKPGKKRIGLRADMDALPIREETNFAYASQTDGIMHACGHDAHMTMLLGAAQYLALTRNFSGTVILIFQPAEEGLGGARAMIEDGLFERFPCDEIYGMHNNPNGRPGLVKVKPGIAMAGACFFDITVKGVGSHAAMPEDGCDSIMIVSALVGALHSIVSRNVAPIQPAVLSVTKMQAGNVYNILPESAIIGGTVRYFHKEVRDLIKTRIKDICSGFSIMHGVEIDVQIQNVFDVLVNDADLSEAYLAAAAEIVGEENTIVSTELTTGSEDFADMLQIVPGAYCTLGHSGAIPVHNPSYSFDDTILPMGASILARIAEKRLQI